MIAVFKNNLDCNIDNYTSKKYLLAVSGGADSLAMSDLFFRAKLDFEIAHCNFHLRGEDSNLDENFVRQIAQKYQKIIHVKHFDTESYAKENGISIEMAARELRYNFFENLLNERNLDYCAIAHHKDDNVETILLNLTRGTGIKGLCGMQFFSGKYIRPLLNFTRKEIENYCKENNLNFCIDYTNNQTIYKRNKFRLDIIPQLKEINQNFDNNLVNTASFLTDVYQIYIDSIQKHKEYCTSKLQDLFLIDINKLCQFVRPESLLFEILKDYGFNSNQTLLIAKNLNQNSGKIYYSKDYQLVKDRNNLIISSLEDKNEQEFFVSKDDINKGEFVFKDKKIRFSIVNQIDSKNANCAYFDVDKLDFPLQIRSFRQGDYFYPFGMNNKKKLSDFFIDKKLSILQKKNVFILCCNNNIIYIMKYRQSNLYKIGPDSKNILKIECLF